MFFTSRVSSSINIISLVLLQRITGGRSLCECIEVNSQKPCLWTARHGVFWLGNDQSTRHVWTLSFRYFRECLLTVTLSRMIAFIITTRVSPFAFWSYTLSSVHKETSTISCDLWWIQSSCTSDPHKAVCIQPTKPVPSDCFAGWLEQCLPINLFFSLLMETERPTNNEPITAIKG